MRARFPALGRQAFDVLVASLVAGLLLAATMVACRQDDDGPAPRTGSERAEPGRTAAGAAAGLDLTVRVTRVSGRLPAARREAVAAKVGRVIGTYVQAAYLEGAGAGQGAAATRSVGERGTAATGAFAAFTPDAARQARRDRDLLTSAGFGDARKVQPLEATAFLSVLAPKGRPVGATARTTLRFAVTGADGTTRQRQVRGRVLLTPQNGDWRIFGYELSGTAAAGAER
jgi:hypothetical protein